MHASLQFSNCKAWNMQTLAKLNRNTKLLVKELRILHNCCFSMWHAVWYPGSRVYCDHQSYILPAGGEGGMNNCGQYSIKQKPALWFFIWKMMLILLWTEAIRTLTSNTQSCSVALSTRVWIKQQATSIVVQLSELNFKKYITLLQPYSGHLIACLSHTSHKRRKHFHFWGGEAWPTMPPSSYAYAS